MRFALLGSDSYGRALTDALLQSDSHELLYYFPEQKDATLPEEWGNAKLIYDGEEIRADPAVEMIIVASHLDRRADHLRRSIQSERHVLCLYPTEAKPDSAYEASMIQQETGYLLMPLIPELVHPALRRLHEILSAEECMIGSIQLVDLEHRSAGPLADETLCLPNWTALRMLGGEIVEVSLLASEEEIGEESTLLVSGRFEKGGMFQQSLMPNQQVDRYRIRILGTEGELELFCPLGLEASAILSWHDSRGELQEEHWNEWSPWELLAEELEASLEQKKATLDWQDAIRALELDDAVRRSHKRGKTVQLEYPDAGEEVNFKGTMTLIGCALLWIIILLAFLSRFVPWLGWGIGPVLFIFLVTQLLRYVIPSREEESAPDSED